MSRSALVVIAVLSSRLCSRYMSVVYNITIVLIYLFNESRIYFLQQSKAIHAHVVYYSGRAGTRQNLQVFATNSALLHVNYVWNR